ncbi:hypothetical protein GCM10011352_24570 [Marinobacterium zhoushanense]|uniref:DUF4426 domain-containing protein n=1 Tax=Marinobacterium zhoushanense TaxID=1679163 RepID=A0ABQ1KEG0_9GAMM|nr:DUF4426 domain-containing protein [Marinobacterium zhoushanense]GGB97525.1 hypothetical protein GCM10011352_24570 [Marinobacterium zhoushanense]
MALLRTLTHLGSALLLSLLAVSAQAEQSISDGKYEIHYNAFNSTFITPEVAQQYNLTRSSVRALVNVTILKIGDDGGKTPVRAQVRGQAANLLQQAQQLEFQLVDEGQAMYYIGSFRFTEEEKQIITLEVQPDANMPPYNIEFEQTFYTN